MLQRITRPEVPLLSLQEVKAHLRLDHALEDEYLLGLVQSATEWVEHEIGRALLFQSWQKIFYPQEGGTGGLVSGSSDRLVITLDYPPLQEVLVVEMLMPNGVKKVLRRYLIETSQLIPRLTIGYQAWPIAVTYRSGYGERPNNVPATLRQAVLLVSTHFYENRGPDVELKSPLLQSLLAPFRVTSAR